MLLTCCCNASDTSSARVNDIGTVWCDDGRPVVVYPTDGAAFAIFKSSKSIQ